MFKKFSKWLRIKIQLWLNIPETYVAADYGYRDATSIIVLQYHRRNGVLELICDHHCKDVCYQEIRRRLEYLAKTYRVRPENIVEDKPHGLSI